MAAKTIALISLYQLKITLRWVKPPVWRQVLVPSNVTLAKLHRTIQAAMGWEDAHLHQFMVGERVFAEPEPGAGGFDNPAAEDERKIKLSQLGLKARSRLHYEYDFGDGWEHEVVVEKILEPEPGQRYPLCLAGARACPPEDCGGPPGYDNLLQVLADPKDPEHEDMLDWLGVDDFDPEAFDLKKINARLGKVK